MIAQRTINELAQMTGMEQTARIQLEAQKKHMEYGEFVAKYGDILPPPKKREDVEVSEVEQIPCRVCGKWFTPKKLPSGRLSQATRCEECVTKARVKKAEDMHKPRVRHQKVRQATCDVCGGTYETAASRRAGIPSYCPICREVKRKERTDAYNKKRYAMLKRG